MTMETTVSSALPFRKQSGTTLVEVAIFTMIIAPMLVALATTVTVFQSSADSGRHLSQAAGENKRILDRIGTELLQTTTRRDHPDVGVPELPQTETETLAEVNSAYEYPVLPIGFLHETMARDQAEFWHPEVNTRRFYIYATYQPFDTIEYQKVRTPLDGAGMGTFIAGPNQVNQPWSTSRKIFLEGDRVLLRVRRDGGGPEEFETVVLGTHVESLKFHLNQDGHIIVRLTTVSGNPPDAAPGGASKDGVRVTNQIVVAPRNALF